MYDVLLGDNLFRQSVSSMEVLRKFFDCRIICVVVFSIFIDYLHISISSNINILEYFYLRNENTLENNQNFKLFNFYKNMDYFLHILSYIK